MSWIFFLITDYYFLFLLRERGGVEEGGSEGDREKEWGYREIDEVTCAV